VAKNSVALETEQSANNACLVTVVDMKAPSSTSGFFSLANGALATLR
jgi:hypothetical protein